MCQPGAKRQEVSPRGQRCPSQASRDGRSHPGVRGVLQPAARRQEVSFQESDGLLSGEPLSRGQDWAMQQGPMTKG